jgi:hypothetical protein
MTFRKLNVTLRMESDLLGTDDRQGVYSQTPLFIVMSVPHVTNL